MFQTVLTFIGVIDAVMIAIILAGRIDVSSKLFWIAAVLHLTVVPLLMWGVLRRKARSEVT